MSPSISLLTPIFFTLAAPAAPPAPPKHLKPEVIVRVPQPQLTRPARPSPERPRRAEPVLTLDQFIGQRQEKLQQINQTVLDRFQRLLRVTGPEDPARADMHFRIAELYAEQQRHSRFLARGLDQKIFEASPGQQGALQHQQKQHERGEEAWKLRALESYLAASRYPRYERMDEVLYRLATLLGDSNRQERAREFFLRLIRDYPGSKYIPDAYLAFAQFYFDQGEVSAARKFYEKVAQFPRSAVFGYALYKKAWCDIDLGDYRAALAAFVELIALARAGKAGNGPLANRALERAAQGDAVKAFARTPGTSADRAWEFCSRIGGDSAPKMMEALAELYWEQGMLVDSTRVYHRVMALSPSSPRLCEWQGKVLRNAQSLGHKPDQVQEIRRLAVTFDRIKSNPAVKRDQLEECRVSLHDTSRELVQVWHQEAQKTRNPDTYLLVRDLYRDHLIRFGTGREANELRFFYGEVLWATRAYAEAARQYTRVVETDPRGKLAREAAWAAVLAWKNALDIDDTGKRPEPQPEPGQRDVKPRPIPPAHQNMIAAFDTYIKQVPDAPELAKVRYNKARIYYEHKHFLEAAPLFAEVVDKHPEHELAIYSAHLMLESLNSLDRTADVIRWVADFMTRPSLMKDVGFARDMISIRSDGLVHEGKQHERARNWRACGQAMLQAAESLPEHPKHAERLHDAAFCFGRARLVGRAVAVRRQLIEQHPDDPLAQKALHDLAGNYQQIAVYDHAAKHFEQFATRFPGETHAPGALGSAYTFRTALGEYDRAIQDLKEFVRLYAAGRPREAAEAFFQIGEIYERQSQAQAQIDHLETYLRRWAGKGTIDKQIVAHFKLGEHYWKKSCPESSVDGACLRIERAGASGRQRVFDDINRGIKGRQKKLKEKGRTQCGALSRARITVVARDARDAKTAQQHFATVLKLYAGGAAQKRLPDGAELPARAGLIRSAAAGSTFYQGERLYEVFLALKFPQGLELQPPSPLHPPGRAAALRKKYAAEAKILKRYLDEKGRLAQLLSGPSPERRGIYDRVVELRVADWTIAASARTGQIWANFANQLYTAPIPRWLRDGDDWGRSPRDLYCDHLEDTAEPLENRAIQSYTLCLRAAQEQSRFDSWSTMCELELGELRPNEFPVAAEIRPQPGYAPVFIFPAGVITRLDRPGAEPVAARRP